MLSLSIGMACLFSFKSIGSTIDENGFLHEPFPLLPIGWLFIFMGICLLLVYGAVRIFLGWMHRRNDSRGEKIGDAKSD